MSKFQDTLPHTIITHPGQAHRDDFLACCVMLAKHDLDIYTIERREPTKAELADPAVMVLDVGEDLDPMLRNYDHHQLTDIEGRPEVNCAFHQVVRHELELEEEFGMFQWYKMTAWMDSQGPHATAKEFGLKEWPFFTMSPVESTMLRLFESGTEFKHGEPFFDIMKAIGISMTGYIENYANGVETCLDATKSINMEDGTEGILMVDDPKLQKYLGYVQRVYFPGAKFSITLDDRGDGHSLYRFDDYEGLDFSKVADHKSVHFAHPGGFIAKTVGDLTMGALLELVGLSLV